MTVPYYNNRLVQEPGNFSPLLSSVQNVAQTLLTGGGAYDVFFSDVARVRLTETAAADAQITIGMNTGANPNFLDESAPGIPPVPGYTLDWDGSETQPEKLYGDVWLNADFMTAYNAPVWNDVSAGSFGFSLILHELGHAMGLAHPFGDSRASDHRYTVMSYMPAPGMDAPGPAEALPTGLQLYDVLAIQSLYGRNYETRSADTTYDAAGAFASGRANGAFLYTIWDGGGTDTVDARHFDNGVKIDLAWIIKGCTRFLAENEAFVAG